MATVKASAIEIQNAIDDFTDGLDKMSKQQFNKVYALLKDLSLDADGNIKTTIDNLKIIQRINNELNTLVDNPKYQKKVAELQYAIDNVQKLQTQYYVNTFKDFTLPKSINKLNELTFDNVVDQLAGAGISENVINVSAGIVEENIRSNANFYDLVNQLEVKMLGNKEIEPRLISYSKQIINDTLSSFARNYHNIVTADLDFEWFVYIGALMDTSRPFCIKMVEKHYVHKSEFAGCISGRLIGLSTKKAHEGMFPHTNANTLINNCGGYSCNHQLVGVPSVTVPTELRRKFEPNLKADNKEKANKRPQRK